MLIQIKHRYNSAKVTQTFGSFLVSLLLIYLNKKHPIFKNMIDVTFLF